MLSACTISCDSKLHKITTCYVKMCYFLSLLSWSRYSFVTLLLVIILWALVSFSSAVTLLFLNAFLNIVHIALLVFCSSISLVVRQLLFCESFVLLLTVFLELERADLSGTTVLQSSKIIFCLGFVAFLSDSQSFVAFLAVVGLRELWTVAPRSLLCTKLMWEC